MASRYLEPEIERRSRAAMTRWQAGRLREQGRRANAHSPFYRRTFKARSTSSRSSSGATRAWTTSSCPSLRHPRWPARSATGWAGLGESLRTGLGPRVSVEVTEPGAPPRWDHKARRVKDERTEVPV